jgi:hypothetical protein
MYCLVIVGHNGMAGHLTSSDWRVLRSALWPMQWMELMICCAMVVMRLGMLGVNVRKMKALTESGDSDSDW